MLLGWVYPPWRIGSSLATMIFTAYPYGSLDDLQLGIPEVRFRLSGPLPPEAPNHHRQH
jgi:hypothetical protein